MNTVYITADGQEHKYTNVLFVEIVVTSLYVHYTKDGIPNRDYFYMPDVEYMRIGA